MQHKRLILGLGAGALALAVAGVFSVSTMTIRQDSIYQTDGPSYAEVGDITAASHAVVHVKIISSGKSYIVPFDAPVVHVAPAPTDGDKAKYKGSSSTPGVALKDTGVLHTDFTVEVLDNIRGSSIKKGDHLVVSQIGGVQKDGGIANAEHDALMQVGDQEVLFLRHDAVSGKYFTTGGGQGRFKVQNNGTLSPVDTHSNMARLQTGKPLSFLKSQVQSAQINRGAP